MAKPKYRHSSIRQEKAKAERGNGSYYPEYKFRGRTFVKRDVPGPVPS